MSFRKPGLRDRIIYWLFSLTISLPFFFFKVKTVNFQAGDKVAEGDIMVEIEHHPDH